MVNEVNNLFEFANFRFDGATLKLWHNGEQIFLSPKASELLRLLIERRGEFVSKEEIFKTVWAGTFVEDGVLTQNIYTLRKALGNGTDNSPLIENRTRRGYRITVPVEIVENANGSSANGNQILPIAASENIGAEIIEADSTKTPAKIIETDLPKIIPAKKNVWKKRLAILAVGLILLSVGGFFGYRFLRPRIASFFLKPIETVKFQSLTNTGDIYNAALSPDGNFLAYIKNDKVFLKDTASGKDIPVQIPNVAAFGSVQFSSDGSFLYVRNKKEFQAQANVLKVSRFGGETILIAERIFGDFDIAPDGKQIAFYRALPQLQSQQLIIKNLETGAERGIFTKEMPSRFLPQSPPAWSPDGRNIAFITQTVATRQSQLFVIDALTKVVEEIKSPQLRQFTQAAWLPDGESLVVAASEGGRSFQLWKLYYPSGDVQRMTNGLNSYGRLSVTADGKKMLAMQTAEYSNIFAAETANLNEQKQLTFGKVSGHGQASLDWIDEERIVFPAQSEENLTTNLWLVNTADNSSQQLTANTDFASGLPTSDGKFIYFTTNRNRAINISRMDASGGNLIQITDGTDGNRNFPQISSDGNNLYYIFRNRERGEIRRFDGREQKETVFFASESVQPTAFLSLSADGKYLVFFNWTAKDFASDDKNNAQVGVVSTENPSDVKLFDVATQQVMMRAAPDGKAFDYITFSDENGQIIRQSFAGGEPETILTLPKERIFNFAWSKSGTRLAISRGQTNKDAVLLTNFE